LPALLLDVARDFRGGGRIVGGRPARVKQRHAAPGMLERFAVPAGLAALLLTGE